MLQHCTILYINVPSTLYPRDPTWSNVVPSRVQLCTFNVSQCCMTNTISCNIVHTHSYHFLPGLHKSCDNGTFTWPEKISCHDLNVFLDAEDTGPKSFFHRLKMPSSRNATNWDNVLFARWQLQRRGKNPDVEPWLVDHAAGFAPTAMYNCSPCFIKGRRAESRT